MRYNDHIKILNMEPTSFIHSKFQKMWICTFRTRIWNNMSPTLRDKTLPAASSSKILNICFKRPHRLSCYNLSCRFNNLMTHQHVNTSFVSLQHGVGFNKLKPHAEVTGNLLMSLMWRRFLHTHCQSCYSSRFHLRVKAALGGIQLCRAAPVTFRMWCRNKSRPEVLEKKSASCQRSKTSQ